MMSIGVGRDSTVYRCWEGQCSVYKVLEGTVPSIGVGRDSAVFKVLGGTVLSLRCWERQCCL